MFIEFQFGNFRSFRDNQKFSLQASPLRSNDNGLNEDHVFEDGGFRLLRTKAILGANGSGKSNLAEAIGAFRVMVTRSVIDESLTETIWKDRFQRISDWDDQPVFFQLAFLHNSNPYRYGFRILDGKIFDEWLFGTNSDGIENQYFFRQHQELAADNNLFEVSDLYSKELHKKNSELFRNNSLFLTSAALTGHVLSSAIREKIRSIDCVDGVNDEYAMQYAVNVLEKGHPQHIELIKRFLKAADTGIEDLELKELPVSSQNSKSKKVKQELGITSQLLSKHLVYDHDGNVVDTISVPFDDWESEGTSKLLGIGALVLERLSTGGTLVIDEFDARFHPNISLKIVALFNDKDVNPKNAQLIFVTHDSSLLRRAQLRRDQICLVDKDQYGISTTTVLIEYKGVRKDASYDKEYLQGTYNGIPFLDELDDVIYQNNRHHD